MADQDRLDFLSENWTATRPEIDISPWGIWGRITRINEIFLSCVGRTLKRHALTYSEFQTLGALVLSGEPYEGNPNQIGAFNLLTSGGLANLLGRMEREGLLARRPDPTDRRGVIVRLTETGLSHFNEAVIDENRMEHEMVGALTPLEKTVLGLLLKKLLLSIDSNGEFSAAAPSDMRTPRGRAER